MTARAIIFEDEPDDGLLMRNVLYYFGMFSEKGQRRIIKLLEFWLKYISRKVA